MKIYEFINKPSGLYGLGGIEILPEDLLPVGDIIAGAGLSLDDNNNLQFGNDGAGYLDLSQMDNYFGVSAHVQEGPYEIDSEFNIEVFNSYLRLYMEDNDLNEDTRAEVDLLATGPNQIVLSLKVEKNNDLISLELDTSGTAIFTDDISSKGLVYDADYSENGILDDRWIPDWGAVKTYADSVGGGGTVVIAGNGLYFSGDTLNLGYNNTDEIGNLSNGTSLICVDGDNVGGISFISEEQFGLSKYYNGFNQTMLFQSNSNGNIIEILDDLNSKGLQYQADYSAVGTLDPRWIPDWGAVTNYVDGSSGEGSFIEEVVYTMTLNDIGAESWDDDIVTKLHAYIVANMPPTEPGKVYSYEVIELEYTYPNIRFGALYNRYAVLDIRGISNNDNWVVPTYSAGVDSTLWESLLGGLNGPSGVLKETGFTNWDSPNTDATNTTGFTAVGSGQRWMDTFSGLMTRALFHLTPGTNGEIAIYHDDDETGTTSGFGQALGSAVRLCNPNTSLAEGEEGYYYGNDLKAYPTKVINGVEWMTVNLTETKYRNGDWIQGFDDGEYTPLTDWNDGTEGKMCYYDNDESNAFYV